MKTNWSSEHPRIYDNSDFDFLHQRSDLLKINLNKTMLDKIKRIFSSRTVWTFIVLFVINGVDGVRDLIPSGALPAIDGLLTVLGIYFRVNPR